jgi:hypothetical protein
MELRCELAFDIVRQHGPKEAMQRTTTDARTYREFPSAADAMRRCARSWPKGEGYGFASCFHFHRRCSVEQGTEGVDERFFSIEQNKVRHSTQEVLDVFLFFGP